jgi:acetamidase/formamidase
VRLWVADHAGLSERRARKGTASLVASGGMRRYSSAASERTSHSIGLPLANAELRGPAQSGLLHPVSLSLPPAWGRLTSVLPRAFGGNMDKELVAGSILYLPVFNEGALFSIGDGHAVQGDGEVCLTAIETGMRGTVRLTVRKDLRLDTPRAETPDAWITMGFDEDLDDAAKQALREMIKLLSELTGLERQDAYTLCSLAANLRVTQMVDVNKGIHCMLRKEHLPARA